MKYTALLASFLLLTVHAGAETRTFTCPTGERTFDGRLAAYDSGSKTVTVMNAQGHTLHFDISLISKPDQEYVIKNAPALPVNVSLDVRFEQLRDRQDSQKSGNTRRSTYDAGYTITLNDYSGQGLQNAEVEYLLIYRKDEVSGSGGNMTVSGRKSVSVVPNGSHKFETDTVQLVSFFQSGQVRTRSVGGGCRGGGCGSTSTTATRSKRSRDFLVGCIAQIKVNGVVVETAATAPNILRQYKDAIHYSDR